MEFLSSSLSFPMFPREGESAREVGGQKLVCTPEVSLYQYEGRGGDEKALPPGFQCGFCGKSFQQKNTFQNHLRSHREGEDPYQCDICGKTFAVPARLTRHYRTHTGEKPYQCEYCNKSFSVKENLSVHRRIHTKERPYKCEVCERAFEHSGKLHRHMRIHTGERPHRCSICQKTFIQSGQLVIHMRTHTGEKPYVCKVCNKGFTCSKQLKVHTRTHTGEKPYTCDICGKSFGYNHVLKLHQVAHYGEKVYKCTLCNGTFTSKKSLETHIKTHSSSNNNNSISHESSIPSVVSPPSPTPPVLSPSSQGPPNTSDKENRESSDDSSEISSQNSPNNLDAPKTPPSPPSFLLKPSSTSLSLPGGIPYPMLPPGIQVHQAPQSRTTFLYVTSKLPPSPTTSLQSQNSPILPRPDDKVYVPSEATPKGLNLPFGIASGMHGRSQGNSEGEGWENKREKVLAFIEKFGANPIHTASSAQQSYSRPFNGFRSTFTTPDDNMGFKPHMDFLQHHQPHQAQPQPRGRPRTRTEFVHHPSPQHQMYHQQQHHPQQHQQQQQQQQLFSPNHPGGVLAMALTRGSKAVNSVQGNRFEGRNRSPEIPEYEEDQDLCIDFSSSRRGSTSPGGTYNAVSHKPALGGYEEERGASRSVSPSSTPGLSESAEDLSDEYGAGSSSSMTTSVSKRKSNAFGPRKRSSLILEKYAQENPNGNSESILSQRLRLSSVIQYAEKCT